MGEKSVVEPIFEASFFKAFRSEGYPTIYDENKTPAHVDVLEAGLITSLVIIGFCLLIVLPAARGYQKLFLGIRICLSIIIGGIIIVTNYGYKWEVGHIVSRAAYKPLINDEVKVSVGLNIGLRAINVTLKANPHEQPESLRHEIIDYNEHFCWGWDQGRFGFGPFAGRINREFREAQRTGLPLPILWVVDYFTFDGEGYRFGRFYRTAGWYTHIAIWSAFPVWALSVILLHCAVHYGSLLLSLTGALQILACILWSSIRNAHELYIPFEDAILTTKYGSDFWLTLVNGIFCFLLGIILRVFVDLFPTPIFTFFGIDPQSDYEEIVITSDNELYKLNSGEEVRTGDTSNQNQMEMGQINQENHEEGEYSNQAGLGIPETYIVRQRRSSFKPKRTAPIGVSDRALPAPPPRRLPPLPPQNEEEEEPVYGNYTPGMPPMPHGYRNQAFT